MGKTLSTLALVCAAGAGLAAQAATLGSVASPGSSAEAVVRLQLDRLGTEDGLSHNSVFAILQDSTGFLWFGTQDGLNRYDGREFVVYKHDPDAERTIASNLVTALLEDRRGRLWIGTAGGLDRLASDGSTFEHVALPAAGGGDSPGRPRVNRLLEEPAGPIWVATNRGLVGIDETSDSMRLYRHDPGDQSSLAADDVRSLQLADNGALWVLTEREGHETTLHRLRQGFERTPIPYTFGFFLETPERIWLDAQSPMPIVELGSEDDQWNIAEPLTSAARDTEDRLWLGSYRGLYLSHGDSVDRVETTRSGQVGLTDEINSIAIDRAGAVWIGTYGGLLRHDPNRKPFTHIGQEPGAPLRLTSEAVSAIVQDAEGDLWVGTYGAGVDRIPAARDRVIHQLPTDDDPDSCNGYVWSLERSRTGRLWIGTRGGLCSLEPDGSIVWHPLPGELRSARLLSEDATGTLWIGTEPGLYRYSPTLRTGRLVTQTGIVAETINALRIAPDGAVWYGRAQGDVARYDPASDSERIYPAIAPEGIWDIQFGDGVLWLATGNGLFKLDPQSGDSIRIEPDSADIGSVFYSVAADDQGRLWLGTNGGLVRFDPDTDTERFKRYGPSDGVGSVEFNRHAVLRTDAGELIFGGMNGLTIFHPADLHDNPFVPPVAFTGVEVLSRTGGRTVHPVGPTALTLTPDDYAVSFQFAALNFTQSQNNRYAYMLEGFDADWIDAGSEPAVRYTSLPPGEYVFRARGSNNDGVWNEESAALAVTVLPPYWQTWWFRLVVLLAVVAALTSAYQLRVRHLVQLERMRLRIASDLHDELGSDLSGIALTSAMLGRGQRLSDAEKAQLSDISGSASRIMDGLRDIVWYINPEHDTLESMQARMRAIAQRVLVDLPHEFDSRVGDLEASVPMDVRRNLVLAYKEILHNAVRHANARHVSIGFDVDGDLIRVEVIDDGVGVSEPAGDGTGLRSIRRRVDDMGGRLLIEAPEGGGTQVRVEVDMTRSRRSRPAEEGLR